MTLVVRFGRRGIRLRGQVLFRMGRRSPSAVWWIDERMLSPRKGVF
jgi:hypothetical protein